MRRRTADPAPEGLRERKKRLMRQQLSDTATEMFMERGFEAVRVAEIAEACGVSEKTVFNYFPTKEALILDLGEATLVAMRTALTDAALTPVQAVLQVLADELHAITEWLEDQEDPAQAAGLFLRFAMLIHSTPSLRAYQHDMNVTLAHLSAEMLAQRVGAGPDDPEPQIAASALVGLWPIQFQALSRHLAQALPLANIEEGVTTQVLRAARLLENGLGTLGSAAQCGRRSDPSQHRAVLSPEVQTADDSR